MTKCIPCGKPPIAVDVSLVGYLRRISDGHIRIASRGALVRIEAGDHILSKLGSFVAPILGIYLVFKIGDMFVRETFVYLFHWNLQSCMFIAELVFGSIIPLVMLLNKRVLRSPLLLFIASSLVIFGVLLNRIDNFIVAYKPPYATAAYFPSFGEISVTVGCAAMLILLYRVCVMVFPVITHGTERHSIKTSHEIAGVNGK